MKIAARQPLRRLGQTLAIIVAMIAGTPVGAGEDLIEIMKKPGHIAFMRHAWAPFEGAPRGQEISAETLGPCETQRNIDARGRDDAARIGALFKARGLTFDAVYTSKWCRCRETAELIMGRTVENLQLINSFYTDPDKTKGPIQIARLKAYLNGETDPKARMLMVTHGSLITALAGIDTDETEVVVVKADGKGGVTVVGRGVP
jgi:phosphohistidine phosphatase SixA